MVTLFSFCTICGIIYPIEPAEPLNNAYHGGSFKSQLRAQRRIKKAVARFGAEQPPARLLTVRTMWETQKVSPGVPFGASGGFLFFGTWKPGKAPSLITLYRAFPGRYATHGGCNRPKTARCSHGGYIMRLIPANQRW